MANFNRDNRSGGGRDFGGRSSRPPMQMHKATCSNCGNECEVPFRPTGSKPVFCSRCFETHGGSESRRSDNRNFDRNSDRRSGFEEKQMFDAMCDECGKNCQVPFRPTSGKPVYCSECFENRGNQSNRGGNRNQGQSQCECQCKGQVEALNAKLDKILKLLTPAVSTETAKIEKIVEKSQDSKPKEKAKAEKTPKVSKKAASAKKE